MLRFWNNDVIENLERRTETIAANLLLPWWEKVARRSRADEGSGKQ